MLTSQQVALDSPRVEKPRGSVPAQRPVDGAHAGCEKKKEIKPRPRSV